MTKRRKSRKKSLHQQGKQRLRSQFKRGVSRHEIKNREDFGKRSPYIHTTSAMKRYTEITKQFIDWCIDHEGVSPHASLNSISPYAEKYLKYRNDNGYAKATIKTDRAALGRLFKRDIKFEEEYQNTQITKSRALNGFSRNDRLNPENNKFLITIAKATGGRRSDLERVRYSDFKIINNDLYVTFKESKGGKTRTSPILNEYKEEVLAYIKDKPPLQRLFVNGVNSVADIHAYRRYYAQKLFIDLENNENLHEKIKNDLELPNRKDFTYEKGIKGDEYISTKDNFRGKRDNIYIVSMALGHNRLSVSVQSYLT